MNSLTNDQRVSFMTKGYTPFDFDKFIEEIISSQKEEKIVKKSERKIGRDKHKRRQFFMLQEDQTHRQ